MSQNLEKLRRLLAELFQLDQADLDFGIYRIMNQKRDEITRFLDKDLLPQVRNALSEHQSGDQRVIESQLKEAIEQAKGLGIDPETSPKVKELKAKYQSAGDPAALEQEIFSDLTNFFRRYYHEGDFLSLRRYKEGVYAIPYEGEEVKLHWANHDQYYVKSSEYFRDYTFKLPSGRRVHFKLVEADTEKDNQKAGPDKERRFMLCESNPVDIKPDELFIHFLYQPDPQKRKQSDHNAAIASGFVVPLSHRDPAGTAGLFDAGSADEGNPLKRALQAANAKEWIEELSTPAPTEKNPDRTLLEKHLTDYTARNTFDYFIHKDLGGFLRRELDFYIKNEVMHLDDIESESAPRVEQYLGKIRALRRIAHKIIAFLEQLENFQKKLWLKKKFVVETNYCITLDRVPGELYVEIAASDAQREEWVRLFAIDEIQGDLHTPKYSKPLTVEFLKANPFLVLDTRFFDPEFKDRLLASIQDLDENTDGLLVHGENFQALNLIETRYREQIKCIYIDPPYNAIESEILYKNEYKHSTWISLVEDRVALSREVLSCDGLLCVTIDDYESHRLRSVLDRVFFDENYMATVVIRNNPSGRATTKGFAINHEYALFYSKLAQSSEVGRLPHSDSQRQRYDQVDEEGKPFEWENFRKSSRGSDRPDRPKQFFPIYFDEAHHAQRIPGMEWLETSKSWRINEKTRPGEVAIWPIDDSGVEKVWNFGVQRAIAEVCLMKVMKRDGKYEVYKRKYLREEGSLPRTWWDSPAYSARDNGTKELKEMFGPLSPFDFPKSLHAVKDCVLICSDAEDSLVLDFFAGSGTTGHAVINLNRDDARDPGGAASISSSRWPNTSIPSSSHASRRSSTPRTGKTASRLAAKAPATSSNTSG